MRVLWITCHLPAPALSGGRLREHELLRRAGRSAEIDLIAVSKTPDADEAARGALEGVRSATIVPAELDADACCAQVGRHASAAASAAVHQHLRDHDYDVVHVEGFYLAQHLPDDGDVPVLLVEQNVEVALWEQRAAVARRDLDRIAALHEAARCGAVEVAAWQGADLCAFVTDDDARLAATRAPGLPAVVVPDGFDHLLDGSAAGDPVPHRAAAPTVCFVGNFAYDPNVDAARFLVDDVLPELRRRVPSARLELVGNAPPDWLCDTAAADPGIHVTGWVDSVVPYLQAADAVVCPLRVGGGVKVKMLEALSLGCAVVSTPVGIQGLPPDPPGPLVVPAEAASLADGLARVLCDDQLRMALRRRAGDVTSALPTWDDAADALLDSYRRVGAADRTAAQVPA